MGILDKTKAGLAGGAGLPAGSTGHYTTEVNKGSLNMSAFQAKLNQRWGEGWNLAHVFMQDGNTIMVFERRD